MKMKTWRRRNRLSLRATAKLCGVKSPGYMQEIERGKSGLGPGLTLRIALVTQAMGPDVVLPIDHLQAWARYHPKEMRALRKAAKAAIVRHRMS